MRWSVSSPLSFLRIRRQTPKFGDLCCDVVAARDRGGDMPVAYLVVPEGSPSAEKKQMLTRIYEALSEAYPFPPDHRIFLCEWALESVSQDGKVGSEPARPVLILHAPEGVAADAKRK